MCARERGGGWEGTHDGVRYCHKYHESRIELCTIHQGHISTPSVSLPLCRQVCACVSASMCACVCVCVSDYVSVRACERLCMWVCVGVMGVSINKVIVKIKNCLNYWISRS